MRRERQNAFLRELFPASRSAFAWSVYSAVTALEIGLGSGWMGIPARPVIPVQKPSGKIPRRVEESVKEPGPGGVEGLAGSASGLSDRGAGLGSVSETVQHARRIRKHL